jgi:hypothetical protein
MAISLRKLWLIPLGVIAAVAAILVGLWLLRAQLAGRIAESYFRQHGITSAVHVSRLGLSGVAGRIALGPSEAPDFSAEAIEADFDPLSLVPRLVEVRLVRPVVRARLDNNGSITLPSLQSWLESLQGGAGQSRYVSNDLAISLSGLHAFLSTPGGAVELTGDARLKHNALVAASLIARPASLAWHGVSLRLADASLKVDALSGGYRAAAHFQGSVMGQGFAATGVSGDFSAPLLKLDLRGKSLAMPAFSLALAATGFSAAGFSAANPSLTLQAEDMHGTFAGNGSLRIALHAAADFSPRPLPLLSRDRKLTEALQRNLRHLDLALKADMARQDGRLNFSLQEPAEITGATGGSLRLAAFALAGTPSSLNGKADALLSGPGLPAVSVSSKDIRWQDGALTAGTVLRARFDFDMLHGADIAANGTAAWKNGAFTVRLGSCAPVALKAFHPGQSDLAREISGAICPTPVQAAIAADGTGWKFAALAKDAAMTVPLGNVKIENGAGQLAFSGSGERISGDISVSAARMRDLTAPRRFEPLAGAGTVTLKNWVWQGDFKVADGKNNPLGTANVRHVLDSGVGDL